VNAARLNISRTIQFIHSVRLSAARLNRGNPHAGRQRDNSIAVAKVERIGADQERFHFSPSDILEGGVDFTFAARVQHMLLHSECLGGLLGVMHFGHRAGTNGIDEEPNR
jgi:hypothetical protein